MDTTQTTAALVLRVKKVCEYIFLKQLTEGNESPIGKKMAKAGSRRQSKASHLQEKKKEEEKGKKEIKKTPKQVILERESYRNKSALKNLYCQFIHGDPVLFCSSEWIIHSLSHIKLTRKTRQR